MPDDTGCALLRASYPPRARRRASIAADRHLVRLKELPPRAFAIQRYQRSLPFSLCAERHAPIQDRAGLRLNDRPACPFVQSRQLLRITGVELLQEHALSSVRVRDR